MKQLERKKIETRSNHAFFPHIVDRVIVATPMDVPSYSCPRGQCMVGFRSVQELAEHFLRSHRAAEKVWCGFCNEDVSLERFKRNHSSASGNSTHHNNAVSDFVRRFSEALRDHEEDGAPLAFASSDGGDHLQPDASGEEEEQQLFLSTHGGDSRKHLAGFLDATEQKRRKLYQSNLGNIIPKDASGAGAAAFAPFPNATVMLLYVYSSMCGLSNDQLEALLS